MVDGVARDDFQPLMTARECEKCGYLEFYTRPVSG
jgi:predicted nucleic-acid-binding Zn-ribbon protein